MFFVVPVGRADRLQRISAAEYEIAFEKLWQHSQSKPYLIKTTEARLSAYVLQHLRESNWIDLHTAKAFKSIVRWASLGINDGKGVMFVSHTGAIYPSGFLPVVAGQFPEDHLVDIYQHSPVFLMLRNSDRLQGKMRGLRVSGCLWREPGAGVRRNW